MSLLYALLVLCVLLVCTPTSSHIELRGVTVNGNMQITTDSKHFFKKIIIDGQEFTGKHLERIGEDCYIDGEKIELEGGCFQQIHKQHNTLRTEEST